MFDTMIIAARAIIEATSAGQISTDHAEPQVRPKITVGALCIGFYVNVASHEALVQVISVWAGVQLELPLRNCALIVGRLGQQD